MLVFLGPQDFDRTVVRDGGRNVLHFTEPLTDIGLSTAAHARLLGPPDVHLPPRLVCGEGSDPGNGTLIRVLGRHQVLLEQFAAFPPGVRGGVHVAALRAGDRPLIAAVPAGDVAVRSVRLFDEHGTLVAEAPLPDEMPAPFVITTGRFLAAADDDEQVAIASRDQRGATTPVLVVQGDGRIAGRHDLPRTATLTDAAATPVFGTVSLTTWHAPDRDLLLAWSQPAGALVVADLAADAPSAPCHVATLDLAPADTTLHPSAFESRDLVCGANDDNVASRLHLLRLDGPSRGVRPVATVDVGLRENTFWGKGISEPSGFVRPGGYGPPHHAMICPAWDVVRKTGDAAVLEGTDPDVWIPPAFAGAAPLGRAGLLFPFWSHWHNSWFGNRIGDILDPATGLSRYNVLDERNEPRGEGSLFKGSPSIERQLLLASRAYFWLSAAAVRGPGRDAEQLIGATSLHELGSPLDFNPGNLAAFRRHLAYRWGGVEGINRRFGTAFEALDAVDPPRGRGRGAWDEVGDKDAVARPGSDFFREWRDYNRLVVLSTRWMDATRDGLLAGFAPELMKNHRPGFGKDMSAAGLTMGTSTGGSVYSPLPGVDAERIIVTGPNSSGQWNYSYGEYGAGEELDYEYVRLKWQWKRGLITVNNAPHHGVVEAMLAADGERRPGQTGGVGQVRAVALPTGERFDIAQIGTGPDRNGLLKSLREDGGFEGSTYVVPFHARVLTLPLLRGSRSVAGQPLTTPPVETLSHNDQIELVIEARATGPRSRVTVELRHEGRAVHAAGRSFDVGPEPERLRWCVRAGTLMRDVTIVVSTEAATASIDATAQLEQVARHGRTAGVQHRGGVSFDLLDRDCVARRSPAALDAIAPPDARPQPRATPDDTVPPTWTDPAVVVRFPLDDEIKAVGWMPCIDPDYRVWLTVRGATDNDRIARFEVVGAESGTTLLVTGDNRPTFRLPPLAPLRPQRLEVYAVDRSGNRSPTPAAIRFTSPGVFDFGPEPTTSREDVAFVRHDTAYDTDRGHGWVDTSGLAGRHAGWGRNTLTTCVEHADRSPVFRMNVPDGRYRVVPLVGTPRDVLRSRFTVTAGDARLAHDVRDWTTSVEPVVATASAGRLDVVFPAAHRLFGLVVTPATDTTPPRWTGGPPTVAEVTYDARVPDNPRFAGTHLLDQAVVSLAWPAATDDVRVRHAKILVNGEVWFATNLSSARLRGLPVDTPLSITVEAVDDAGNVATSASTLVELDTRTTGTVLLSIPGQAQPGQVCEAWLNGEPVAIPIPRAARRLPAVAAARIGRNVLCVRLVPPGRQPLALTPEIRFGDRLFDATATWKRSATAADDWLDPDFDDGAWAAATSLVAEGATHLRLAFEIPADASRGALAGAVTGARIVAIEACLESIVIQQLDYRDVPLADVVTAINREVATADQSGYNVRLVAPPDVARRPVTLAGTNRSLRTVLADLCRGAALDVRTSADGAITLTPDQGGIAPTSE